MLDRPTSAGDTLERGAVCIPARRIGERCSRIGFECVGIAMSEVDELRARGRGPGGLLEVVESRQEYRKVVVVDRDGGARFGDLDSPYSLLARHRDNGDQEGRATRVDQAEVNVGVAARDVLQAIDEHGVTGDVEPVELIAVAAEVEQVPVD